MTTHSSVHAWEIPWTEEPGRLQSMGPHRVRHDLTSEHSHTSLVIAVFLSQVPSLNYFRELGKGKSSS